MAATASYESHHEEERVNKTAKTVAGGSIAEAAGGIGAMVLAILGLVGILPLDMMAIACMAAGVALLFEGGAIASRHSTLLSHEDLDTTELSEMSSGMSAEFLGGAAGFTLGLLGLLGLVPGVLIPCAAIVFGGALLLSTGSVHTLNRLDTIEHLHRSESREAVRQSVMASNGAQALVGTGAIALGVLALAGIAPAVLTLVAILGVGASIMLSGSAVAGRMVTIFRQ